MRDNATSLSMFNVAHVCTIRPYGHFYCTVSHHYLYGPFYCTVSHHYLYGHFYCTVSHHYLYGHFYCTISHHYLYVLVKVLVILKLGHLRLFQRLHQPIHESSATTLEYQSDIWKIQVVCMFLL